MAEIRLNGQTWPLKFTLDAMDAIEEATGKTVDELGFKMRSKADRAELLLVLSVLMQAGSPSADVPTPEALRAEMSPGDMLAAIHAASDAVSEGMRMVTDEPEEGEEVDVVLEEIKKKDGPGD